MEYIPFCLHISWLNNEPLSNTNVCLLSHRQTLLDFYYVSIYIILTQLCLCLCLAETQ